VKDREQ